MIAQGTVRESLEKPAELMVEFDDGGALTVRATDVLSEELQPGTRVDVMIEEAK